MSQFSDAIKQFRGLTDNTRGQFLRYIFVGGFAFIVDFGSLFLLTHFFSIHYLISAAIAFILGLATNYVLSIAWVFNKRALRSQWLEIAVFSFIGLVGLGLNEVFMWAFTELAGLPYLVSKVVSTVFILIWNFAARKKILFTGSEEDELAFSGVGMLKRLGVRSDVGSAVGLALLAFVVYNANLRSVTSLDTFATRVLPISIIREANLYLDEFSFLHEYPKWLKTEEPKAAYWVRKTRGHYLSNYPVMPAILSVPFYVVPVLLGLTEGPVSPMGYTRTEIVATRLSKISASAALALSVGIVYLTSLRLTTRRGAFWIALVYAFATSSWSVSSQGLWQTAWSQPLLALALYWFVRGKENARFIVYAGIPLALAVSCRITNAIFAAVFLGYVVLHHRSRAVAFLIFPTLLCGLLLSYNLFYFGNLTGGYTALGIEALSFLPRTDAFLGLLFSPSRGLLVCSPILVFSVWGMAIAVRRRQDPMLNFLAVATILTILFYSCWREWDGGFSYSYRFLVDLVPGLCVFLAVAWDRIAAHRWRLGLFFAAAVFSVFIQVIGAFFFPCGWFGTPVQANLHRERFWDWKDSECLRCLRAGPVEPDGLRFLRSLREK